MDVYVPCTMRLCGPFTKSHSACMAERIIASDWLILYQAMCGSRAIRSDRINEYTKINLR